MYRKNHNFNRIFFWSKVLDSISIQTVGLTVTFAATLNKNRILVECDICSAIVEAKVIGDYA